MAKDTSDPPPPPDPPEIPRQSGADSPTRDESTTESQSTVWAQTSTDLKAEYEHAVRAVDTEDTMTGPPTQRLPDREQPADPEQAATTGETPPPPADNADSSGPAIEDGAGDRPEIDPDTGPPDTGEVADQSRLGRHGHSLPDSATLRYERGPDGLVDRIDGRPASEFVQDLSQQRNDLYRELRTDRTELPDGRQVREDFVRRETGAMHSVLLDRRTGDLFEADNRTLEYDQPTDLHPTLQRELDRMDAFAHQYPDHYDHGRGERGGFPHPDIPGTHAEVAAADQALRAREAAGHPTGPDAMQELMVDNRRLFSGRAGIQAECCANCASILGDIVAIPGKKTEFP